jgi:drug/metabolite transporter (DMT)-like permease
VSDVSEVKSPPVAAPPRRVWIGWAIALTASLSFSIATPLARGALTAGVGATEMLLARMGLATLLMGLTIAVMDIRLLRTDARCIGIALGAGSLNGLGMLLYTWGLQRLTASTTSMLIALSPIAVLSLLALRGEKVTYRHAVRLALALSGAYLLIGPGGAVDPIGVMWILVSLFAFALQLSLLQWFLIGYDARPVTFFVLLAMTGAVMLMWQLEGGSWQPLGWRGWWTAILLATVSTYASRLLLFAAVSRIGGGQMAMLSPVETLLSVLWSFWFLDERLSPLQWMGGALILTSAILAIQRLRLARIRPRRRMWAKS